MIGKEVAQMSLLFGADDLDGTIDDTTRIYSMAGAEDKNPAMTTDEICRLIREAGFEPQLNGILFIILSIHLRYNLSSAAGMSIKNFIFSKTFLKNLGLAAVIVVGLIMILLIWLNFYTRHGQSRPVPDFIGLTMDQTIEACKEKQSEIPDY